jgi:acid phosphatase family membrane protein YuiD
MDYSYVITPFIAWFVAGISKFIINSIKARQWAFDLVGYGGLPSNHSAIVGSMVVLIGIKEGVDSANIGVAITLAFIVILDAHSLRKKVGKQAQMINQLLAENGKSARLRERMGHDMDEIIAGVITGGIVAWVVCYLQEWI